MNKLKYSPKYPVEKTGFALRLKQLRERKNYTKGHMAEVLGVDRKTYGSWESVKTSVLPTDPNTYPALCELLDANLQFLMTGLFGERRDARHEKDYIDVYERYRKDPDFHLIIKVLMQADKPLVSTLAELVERIDNVYRGRSDLSDLGL